MGNCSSIMSANYSTLCHVIRRCRVELCDFTELRVGLFFIIAALFAYHHRTRTQYTSSNEKGNQDLDMEKKQETVGHNKPANEEVAEIADNETKIDTAAETEIALTDSITESDIKNNTSTSTKCKRTTKNYLFYRNEICSQPDGALIEEIHSDWKGKYDELERHHGYIQWLFPLYEKGLNWDADPLTHDELLDMRDDPDIRRRVVESFKLMLDFYGLKLLDDTNEVEHSENFRERYDNLNRRSHNNLRITRIIKCLVLFNLEGLATSMVKTFAVDIRAGKLPNCERSFKDFWLTSLSLDAQRECLDESPPASKVTVQPTVEPEVMKFERKEVKFSGIENAGCLNTKQFDSMNDTASFTVNGENKTELLTVPVKDDISALIDLDINADLMEMDKESVFASIYANSKTIDSSGKFQNDEIDVKDVVPQKMAGEAKANGNYEDDTIRSVTAAISETAINDETAAAENLVDTKEKQSDTTLDTFENQSDNIENQYDAIVNLSDTIENQFDTIENQSDTTLSIIVNQSDTGIVTSAMREDASDVLDESSAAARVTSNAEKILSDTAMPENTIELSSTAAERSSSKTEVQSDIKKVLTDTVEVSENNVELSSTTGVSLPSSMAELQSNTEEVLADRQAVEISENNTWVSTSTTEKPTSTAEMQSDTEEVARNTGELKSTAEGLPTDITEALQSTEDVLPSVSKIQSTAEEVLARLAEAVICNEEVITSTLHTVVEEVPSSTENLPLGTTEIPFSDELLDSSFATV